MKQLTFIAIYMTALFFCSDAKGQKYEYGDTIALPLEYHGGFGPFYVGAGGLSGDDTRSENPFNNTFLAVKGVPSSWKGVKKTMLVIDWNQHIHQNVRNGKISKSQFEKIKAIGYKIDSSNALPDFIKCYVYVVTGIDEQNRTVAVVDQNNNLDFSDDAILFPPDMSLSKANLEKNIVYAQYERNRHGKKHTDTTPILLMISKGVVQYSYPRYATAVLKLDNKDHLIVAGAQIPAFPNFGGTQIALWDGKSRNFHPDSTTKKGEVLLINNEAYEFLSLNLVEDKLLLKKRKDHTEIVSNSLGYKAINFEASEFTSNKTISLDAYKGKYVYIDFWGTWCGPCVAEMPALKKLYSSTKRDQIEIIGIAVDQKPELLKDFLKKHGIAWPQIISNDIADLYKVTYMPTTFLIDPEGRIIAKDLRGEELHKKLEELL